MDKYYYQENGKSYGPFSIKEMRSKRLPQGTYVWYKGLEAWIPIERVAELNNVKQKVNLKKVSIIVSTIIIVIIACILAKSISHNNVINAVRTAAYDDPNVDFSMYMEKFYRDLELYGQRPIKPKTCIIKFSELDKIKGATEINGISYGYNNDDLVEIYINPTFWKQASKAQRYWLMYHELSHDLLNVDDLAAIPSNEGKLMYPYSLSFEVQHMDEFIEAFHEFFESL